MVQLEIFHLAFIQSLGGVIKLLRMFYLEGQWRKFLSSIIFFASYLKLLVLKFVVDGDGSAPETDMFAKFPRTPTDSAPATLVDLGGASG